MAHREADPGARLRQALRVPHSGFGWGLLAVLATACAAACPWLLPAAVQLCVGAVWQLAHFIMFILLSAVTFEALLTVQHVWRAAHAFERNVRTDDSVVQALAGAQALARSQDVPSAAHLTAYYNVPPPVAAQLERAIELVMRDFVMGWYQGLFGDDTGFPLELRRALVHSIGTLALRARCVNPILFVANDAAALLRAHLRVYREMRGRAARRRPDVRTRAASPCHCHCSRASPCCCCAMRARRSGCRARAAPALRPPSRPTFPPPCARSATVLCCTSTARPTACTPPAPTRQRTCDCWRSSW